MKPAPQFRILATIILITLMMPAVSRAQDTPSQIIVFGDSLSDTGNDLIATGSSPVPVPPPQMYYQGRFSNGPVAFEYLWAMLSGDTAGIAPSLPFSQSPPSGSLSFAFGGSGSAVATVTSGGDLPGLLGQVEMFRATLQGQRAPEDALYAIWTGANDYLPVDPATPSLRPAVVVGNIVQAVVRLYSLGARNIVVVNLPDIGDTPLVPAGSALAAQLNETAAIHNFLLERALRVLDLGLRGLKVIRGDVTGVVTALRTEFEATIPLVDVLSPVPPGVIPNSFCLWVNPAMCPVVADFTPRAAFLFWDAEHPTTAAHRRLAQALYPAVQRALRRN